MVHSGEEEFQRIIADLKNLPPKEQRIRAFTFVRDIPFGHIGSREPLDVLKARKGTCSGKNALLKNILESLGYETENWFAKRDFFGKFRHKGKFRMERWPQELSPYRDAEIVDYHTFLKIKLGEKWVLIDAIFDPFMKKFGFPVEEWDGETDMTLPVHAEETFPVEGNLENHKQRLIATHSEENERNRKGFLSAFTEWLNKERTAQ